MKKKFMAVMLASMFAAIPAYDTMANSIYGSNHNYMVSANAADSESTTLKAGDIISLNKSDYDIKPTGPDRTYLSPANGEKLEFIDEMWVYSTELDRDGNNTLVGYMDSDSKYDTINIKYSPQHLYYMVTHNNCSYKGLGNHNGSAPGSGTLTTRALLPDGTWKVVSLKPIGGGASDTIISMPKFDKDSFNMVYDLMPDDGEFKIYKKDKYTGEEELYLTVKKGEQPKNFTFSDTNYEYYRWVADIDYTVVKEHLTDHYVGYLEGSWVADMPYVIHRTIAVNTEYNDTPIASGDITHTNNPILNLEYPETNSNGDIVLDENGNPIMNSIYDIEHGDAVVIKNTEEVQTISAGDLDYGIPVIDNFDETATYFLKIGLTPDAKDFIYYRYDNKSGNWEFRVNTENTPMYNANININTFPDESSSGIMYDKKNNSGNSYDGNEYDSWTKEEFCTGGKSVKILTNNENYSYTCFFDYGKEGGIYYEYVGIDPVPVYSYGNRNSFENGDSSNDIFVDRDGVDGIKSNAKAGDKIIIDGTEPDGTKVHYEVTQKYNNDIIPMSKGEYTVIDETQGLKGEVKNGVPSPSVDDNVLNLVNPCVENTFKISDMHGDTINEGELKGESPVSLNNLINDAGMTSKQVDYLKDEVYMKFETASGISNSSNADDFVTESGYFIIDTSKDAKKGDIIRINVTDVAGDVNQDGKFSIADLVLEQKYLLGNLSKEDNFGIANMIASDVCVDGVSDVYDLVTLRKMFIETMKTDKK